MLRIAISIIASVLLVSCGDFSKTKKEKGDVSKSVAYETALRYFDGRVPGPGQYMLQQCGGTIRDWPNYRGLDVRRCEYRNLGHRGIVYVLSAGPTDIAEWIANACIKVGARQQEKCALALSKNSWTGNNAQFAVAGIVIESEKVLGGRPGVPVSFEFRDGVTVTTVLGYNATRRQLSDREMEASARAAIRKSHNYARIAHIHRDTARDNGVSRTHTAGQNWLVYTRNDYKRALRTGHSQLFNALAQSMMNKEFR